MTIKAPGLTGQADRQVMRFYYENISLTTYNLFDSEIDLSAPSTARVLKYVYYPNSVESGNAHIGLETETPQAEAIGYLCLRSRLLGKAEVSLS